MNFSSKKKQILEHFGHIHNLIYNEEEINDEKNNVCCGCKQLISGPSYNCLKCSFFLHKACAELPREINHPLHRKHPLTLLMVQPFCTGWCEDCNFCLDLKCATLPISVRHRFDEKHPLKLTYDFVSDRSFDHYCEVCEMRIDPGTYVFNYAPWFYGCKECDISIHPECVLGRYPYIKFDRSSAYSLSGIHSHGLTLVQKPFILVKKRKFYPPCDHCAEPFDEDLALQCSQCNFIIHRKGPCFTQNVQQ
ncbi:uncharacterized protein LOC105644233 [Jatropha curcas]|uniref:uncharacterized protein LOC105644233 n=1 Tax=Jatropha curcas TaxID=180498 RepID=UPI001894EDBA|nr:uncharacterized protein LOC105644233 [Jatropha curcas]